MYRTALAVSHTLDIDQLLDRIMQLIFEWVEADRGCVMLFDAETKAARSASAAKPQGIDRERQDHDQQDDSRLCASSATRAC